ncbi:heme-binding protein [Nonomuraea sp. NPDC050153]|uniref:heme-binding protein n=1 Tax=Nonomuraea sp. NPDC050153 TaxID=3364359 RepID=UPI00379806FE
MWFAEMTVVDAAGHLADFARMDGGPVMAIQVATDKAYTAAGFGMSTQAWYEFIKDDAPLAMGAPTAWTVWSPSAAASPSAWRPMPRDAMEG